MLQLGDLAKYIKYLDKSGISGFGEFLNHFGATSEEALKNIVTGAQMSVVGTDCGETLYSTGDKRYVFGKAVMIQSLEMLETMLCMEELAMTACMAKVVMIS
ncbi:hypothetical protein DSECCO2_447020 [anaerobic digester metagenome]